MIASTRRHRFPRAFALLAAVALVATGCGGDDPNTVSRVTDTDSPVSTPDTVAVPDHRSFVATVKAELSSVEVFATPGGKPASGDLDGDGTSEPVTLTNPLPSGAPTTFLVKELDQTSPDGELFHEVYLPVRPNGSSGFVRASDVTVAHTDMAATIDLSDHTFVLTSEGEEIARFTVAVGAADTPTPTGRFFVKELVEPTNPDGAYGPLAYGLSAYSEVTLDTEAFKDGVIGIHGTNRPDLLGRDVSHGCVRIANENVLRLEELQVPLGMPVTIQA